MQTAQPLKVVVVGSTGVGKTSLVARYALGSFSDRALAQSLAVSAFDNYLVDVVVDGKPVSVELVDTPQSTPLPSPNSRNHTAVTGATVTQTASNLLTTPSQIADQLHNRRVGYQDCDVVMLVFAVDNPQSLVEVQEKFFPEVGTYCSAEVGKILVATKQDILDDEGATHSLAVAGTIPITHVQAETVAAKIGATYCPCSAKTREGVDELFETLVRVGLGAHKQKEKLRKKKSDRSCPCLWLDVLAEKLVFWD